MQQSLLGRKLAFDLYCGDMRNSHICPTYLTFLLCCLATVFDISTTATLKCKLLGKTHTVIFLNSQSHDRHFIYICFVMRSREIMWCIAPSGTTSLRISCSVGCAIIFLLVSRHKPDSKTGRNLNSCTSDVMPFSVIREKL